MKTIKKKVAGPCRDMPLEVRAALVDLLAEMLVAEIHAIPDVRQKMVAESPVCHRNSRLGLERRDRPIKSLQDYLQTKKESHG